ncbi:MAG TPA: GntR family transcriptional regulator [Caulobacteraceae bacterium]|jgi:DNA-binding GntR family transcriptional regulator|nr:GntR family transcriptional regulator [Caulobacteraceae bacterium]
MEHDPFGDWAPGLQKAKTYEQLLLDILIGALPAGGLIDERKLAARYGVGLAGVRDALGRLALEGLVVRRPRIGTMVAPLDLREIEQAFEVRHLLEGRSAALAARNAGPDDRIAITSAFDGAEEAIARGDFRAMLAMDRAFHKAVAYATHNPTLARYIIALQNIATRFWIYAMERETPAEQLADVAKHRALGQAIAAGDQAAAEAAMQRVVGEPPSAYPAPRRSAAGEEPAA